VRFAAIVQTHFALAGLALRDVSPSTGVSPLALTPGSALHYVIAMLARSTSCPDEAEIGAFLFSVLSTSGFSATGNCKTVACWCSCRNVRKTISPFGNSKSVPKRHEQRGACSCQGQAYTVGKGGARPPG